MASSSWPDGSLLPFDILESILYRVPAESLNRFKSVCKRWLDLLKDKRFAYNHFDLVQEHFIHFSDIVEIINPETNVRFSLPFPDEFRGSSCNIVLMHCDGLLLCIIKYEFAVWNPLFNQVRWISKPNGYYSKPDTHHPYQDIYGFGYDNISRDNYKILWLRIDTFTCKYNSTFEIYEFKSNCWRTHDVSLYLTLCLPAKSVSVKGNMYWIGISEDKSDISIQCFDFSTETFKFICPLPYDKDKEKYASAYLSGYRKDKLSLLFQRSYLSKPNQPGDIEVWITNNVKDRVVSWIKLFAVSRPALSVLSDCFTLRHYFIDMNNRINAISSKFETILTDRTRSIWVVVKLYIIGKDVFQTKEIGQYRSNTGNYYVCRPSLVLVP